MRRAYLSTSRWMARVCALSTLVVVLAEVNCCAAPVVWDLGTSSGWKDAGGGVLRAEMNNGLLKLDKPLPGDFALRFKFRLPKGVEGQMPLWIKFKGSDAESDFSVCADVAYGMVFNGAAGPFAATPPGPTDPGGIACDSPYEMRIQASQGRLFGKVWRAEQPEPTYWHIDDFHQLSKSYQLTVSANAGVELSAATIESAEAVPLVGEQDLRTVRFARVNRVDTDFRVKETAGEIEISGDTAKLVFSRKGCSLANAYVRGEVFAVGHLPDLRYVSANGVEFRQSYSDAGKLETKGFDGSFFVLEGECRPADQAGHPGPATFDYKYRIHKQIGLVEVAVRCREDQTEVRKFAFVNCLADRPELGIDHIHCGGAVIGPGGPFHKGPYLSKDFKDRWGEGRSSLNRGPVSRDDGVVIGEEYGFGRWSNGKCAFEVQSLSFYGSQFSERGVAVKTETVKTVQGVTEVQTSEGPAMLDDLKSEKFLVAKTHDGKRHLDMVFISLMPEDKPTSIGVAEYKFGFQFLPFRKYRTTNAWFNGLPLFSGTTQIDSVSRRRDLARELACMGLEIANVGTGDVPMTVLAVGPGEKKPLAWQRVKRVCDDLHAFGLRGFPGWWMPGWDGKQLIANGWLKMEDFPHSQVVNYRTWPDTNGVRGYPRAVGVDFCLGDNVIRDMLLEKEIFETIRQYGADGVYLDGFAPLNACENALHGCVGRSSPVDGFIDFTERFRSFSETQDGLPPVLWAHGSEESFAATSLADIDWPGEMFVPAWTPNRAELDSYFTSLLHGRQVIYCSNPGNGGPSADRVDTFEGALSRCSLVQAGEDIVNAWLQGDKTHAGLKNWRRYMLPLKIFGVRNSDVHHPFDQEYGDIAKVSEKDALGVVYSRPQEALLVVVRDIDKTVQNTNVSLNASAMGVAEPGAWCFDTATCALRKLPVQDGWLALGEIDMSQGPQIFHIVGVKSGPQVVWHDQVVWNVKENREAKHAVFALRGVPESDGLLYVACDTWGSPKVLGGKLLSFDAKTGLAVIQTRFDGKARANIVLEWQ